MTEILTAPLHLGTCTGCPAAINWGYQYVEYGADKYHVDCDPEREPRKCRFDELTGCGVVTEIVPTRSDRAATFYTECDECCAKLNWWLWESSVPQLARVLFGRKPPKRMKETKTYGA